MKCCTHKEKDAIGICSVCNQGVCEICAVKIGGKLYCKSDADTTFAPKTIKTQVPASNEAELNLFAHISRLYNSGFTALIAAIFGWLAYFGLFITLILNPNTKPTSLLLLVALILIGVAITIIVVYSYSRILFFGHWIDKIALEFGLYDFAEETSPRRLRWIFRINRRERGLGENWTAAEIFSVIVLSINRYSMGHYIPSF